MRAVHGYYLSSTRPAVFDQKFRSWGGTYSREEWTVDSTCRMKLSAQGFPGDFTFRDSKGGWISESNEEDKHQVISSGSYDLLQSNVSCKIHKKKWDILPQFSLRTQEDAVNSMSQ
ncbi:hypothetical protein Q8A67_012860 [Cirrhinus molitorella]|uniref:Uncharacterized protein n=1 Tax=Cirrhinus molitorella TaxID=172907 RepID=A0AA88PQ06_9TELE|nr:hypothetical protein Q8A67_012860 [Cirrhinus molitorella]